jgi:hypothetical protein
VKYIVGPIFSKTVAIAHMPIISKSLSRLSFGFQIIAARGIKSRLTGGEIQSRPLNQRLNKAIVLLLLILVLLVPPLVSAQSNPDPWTPPVNISGSGSTDNPRLLILPGGEIYAFWEDKLAGFYVSRGDGQIWDTPVKLEAPFLPHIPLLIPGTDGRLRAFWRDDLGGLYYSHANTSQVLSSPAWEARQTLGASTIAFQAQTDDWGRLHLAYLRTGEDGNYPAGIYYRLSPNGINDWTDAAPLYLSPYLRSPTPTPANVQLATARSFERAYVFVTWDNQPRRQVFLASSSDGGFNWTEPLEIDSPLISGDSGTPYNLRVAAEGDRALLVWQKGEIGLSCQLFYRSSSDGGANWSESRTLETLRGCPNDLRIISTSEDVFILMATLAGQVYLLAWDGSNWSFPQVQDTLSSFEDPATLGRVNFTCLQPTFDPNLQSLWVLGCDTGSGGDIWLTSRSLGDYTTWYPPPSLWEDPISVASLDANSGKPIILAGPSDGFHALWAQLEPASAQQGTNSGLRYTHWDGVRWSGLATLQLPSNDLSGSLTAALYAHDRLLVVWGEGTGGLYINQVPLPLTAYESDLNPVRVPVPRQAITSPDLFLTDDETIYLAFALPINEGRGVYMVRSQDLGQTWEDPILAFDAAHSGWEMVDRPQLAIAADGSLQLLFTRYSSPPDSLPIGLYAVRSTDNGRTWTSPEVVVARPVGQSWLLSAGDVLHRAWQENAPSQNIVRHQVSIDGGASWSHAQIVSTSAIQAGPADLTIDSAGRLHLLLAVTAFSGEANLQHWQWDGQKWTASEGLPLSLSGELQVISVSAAISPSGFLSVLYTLSGETVTKSPTTLNFTYRTLDLSGVKLLPPPTPPATSTDTPAPSLSPSPMITPTIDMAYLREQSLSGPLPINERYTSLLLGASLGLILVGVTVGVGIWNRRRR